MSMSAIVAVILLVVIIVAVVTKRSDIIIMIATVGLGIWVLSHTSVCGIPYWM